MVASIEQKTEYPCTVAQLHGALTSDGYWRDRVAEVGNGSEVVDYSVVDGRITSVVNQAIDAEMLPKALQRFAGSRMSAQCTEWWDALDAGSASGAYELRVSRVPIVIAGDLDMIATSDTTCRLRFVGTVEASVPVMGPVVEKIMLGEIDRSFSAERDFTTQWLASRV